MFHLPFLDSRTMKHATKKSWRSIEVRIPIRFFWHRIALGYAKFFLAFLKVVCFLIAVAQSSVLSEFLFIFDSGPNLRGAWEFWVWPQFGRSTTQTTEKDTKMNFEEDFKVAQVHFFKIQTHCLKNTELLGKADPYIKIIDSDGHDIGKTFTLFDTLWLSFAVINNLSV